ncbi:hypothetical protein QBC40DRAFT_322778 [Triangularia verruculosa]|uniref:Uncharacterized protein n=1 Tax=Triangularia verruculosa TaxID=2587418 RepID=A0AAN6XJF1_9PEZI|nr:hypothetical protein QBC40DRAFT_322778 [Triangularia verruculosa]
MPPKKTNKKKPQAPDGDPHPTHGDPPPTPGTPSWLDRWIRCQDTMERVGPNPKQTHAETAYADIDNGKRRHKSYHWHYCMCPCLTAAALGSGKNNVDFNLADISAAKAYLRHEVTGYRLGKLIGKLLRGSADQITGKIVEKLMAVEAPKGAWKDKSNRGGVYIGRLWACMTLFEFVADTLNVERDAAAAGSCRAVLDLYFSKMKEPKTAGYLNGLSDADREPEAPRVDADHIDDEHDDHEDTAWLRSRNVDIPQFDGAGDEIRIPQFDGAGDEDDDGGGDDDGDGGDGGGAGGDGGGDDNAAPSKPSSGTKRPGDNLDENEDVVQNASLAAAQFDGAGEQQQDDGGEPPTAKRAGGRTRKRRRRR